MARVQNFNDSCDAWVQGKEGKELDKVCKLYKELEDKAKEISKAQKPLKDELKALNNGEIVTKSYETENFRIYLVAVSGSESIDLEALKVLYPAVFADKRLYKKSKDYLKLDKVVPKA